ncbi:MAG: YchJ family metal-binding protein [Opitutaceae bacterium]|nr:YchJ family metal-binding protein [Opitutaceae bacterium]
MSSPTTTRPPVVPSSPCPCGSGRTFGECCEPLLKQARPAATAEELMRSRFTAHCIGDHRHLHRTYLETSRQSFVEEAPTEEVQWTRLVIRAHEAEVKPDRSYVDFTAYFQGNDGAEHPMHEKSEFHRIGGEWFFVRPIREGPAPVRAVVKAGRNDPCPCGSGKKFKHCCGR